MGIRRRRHRVAALVVVVLAASLGVVSAPGPAAAIDPVVLMLGTPTTDNYKTYGGPDTTDSRTSLMVHSVQVGADVYRADTEVVQSAPAPGCIGTGRSLRDVCIIEDYDDQPDLGLPVTTAGGKRAYLRYTLPAGHGGGMVVPYFRVFNAGLFGVFLQVDRAEFVDGGHTPLTTTLSLYDAEDDQLLAQTALTYAYDEQVAALGPQSMEYGGPAGRWQVAGRPTPLNWPAAVSLSPTTVLPDRPQTVSVTTTDIAGLPVSGFTQGELGPPVPVALAWDPAGAGRPTAADTFADGVTDRRDIAVDLAAGDYAVTGSSVCPAQVCERAAMTITGAAAITAAEAGDTFQPDIRVRPAGGDWTGAGVHNTDGAGQALDLEAVAGATTTVELEVRNTGTAADEWLLAGVPSTAYADVAHTWSLGEDDVTAPVTDGEHIVTDVPVDGTRTLTLRITPTAAAIGAVRGFFLHAYHRADGTTTAIKDVAGVRITTVAAPEPEPEPTAPAVPTRVSAVAGNGSATVSWDAPEDDGGSPITGYAVTVLPGGTTVDAGTSLSLVVTGLTNGRPYTFTVIATNEVGSSAASAPSAAVRPAGGGGPNPDPNPDPTPTPDQSCLAAAASAQAIAHQQVRTAQAKIAKAKTKIKKAKAKRKPAKQVKRLKRKLTQAKARLRAARDTAMRADQAAAHAQSGGC